MSPGNDSPFFRRMSKQGDASHGKRSEKRVIKKLGGREQPNSGAMEGAKGDGQLNNGPLRFLLECKSTIHESMPVQLSWLAKIMGEALQKGVSPLLSVSFVDASGKAKPCGDWVMMTTADFEELMEKAGANYVRKDGAGKAG